jgi:hypothetical protein
VVFKVIAAFAIVLGPAVMHSQVSLVLVYLGLYGLEVIDVFAIVLRPSVGSDTFHFVLFCYILDLLQLILGS